MVAASTFLLLHLADTLKTQIFLFIFQMREAVTQPLRD